MDAVLAPLLLDSNTEVNVPYTTPEGTRAALATANSFSKDLEIRVRVLAFQVVPYPLDIDKPVVPTPFAVRRILTELKASPHAEFSLHYALCRDQEDALIRSLRRRSVVVIGGRYGLFRSREQRMARKLESIGHEVVFVPIGDRTVGWAYRCRDLVRRWLTGLGHAGEHFLERK